MISLCNFVIQLNQDETNTKINIEIKALSSSYLTAVNYYNNGWGHENSTLCGFSYKTSKSSIMTIFVTTSALNIYVDGIFCYDFPQYLNATAVAFIKFNGCIFVQELFT